MEAATDPIDAFIAETLRLDGSNVEAPHEVSRVSGLRAAWRYIEDVAKQAPRPALWQVLLLAYVINPAHKHGWRRYDLAGTPSPAKVGRVMDVWHTQLATWTPEQAYDALLKVHPFGNPSDRDVGLCVYNWLRGTWRNPVFPDTCDASSAVAHVRSSDACAAVCVESLSED